MPLTQEVQTLVLKVCECVTLQGKRDSADMIKLKMIRMKQLFWIFWVDPK